LQARAAWRVGDFDRVLRLYGRIPLEVTRGSSGDRLPRLIGRGCRAERYIQATIERSTRDYILFEWLAELHGLISRAPRISRSPRGYRASRRGRHRSFGVQHSHCRRKHHPQAFLGSSRDALALSVANRLNLRAPGIKAARLALRLRRSVCGSECIIQPSRGRCGQCLKARSVRWCSGTAARQPNGASRRANRIRARRRSP
jgi:hypothetical protein